MAERWIGAGGWAYFSGPSGNALRDYSRAFSFVEANSTFYELPAVSTARRWRATVPRGFRFSLKAPRTLTHSLRLKASPQLERTAMATSRFAKALDASDVILETPPTLAFGEAEVQGLRAIRDVFETAGSVGGLGLEARAYRGQGLPSNLRAAMRRLDIGDVVDLSTSKPRVQGPVTYARLFGKGEGNRWEFTTDELAAIDARGEAGGPDRIVFAFHGVRMYKDAARLEIHRRTGSYPPATRSVGIPSLAEVLRDGAARFPATGARLLADHGWRVFDTGPSETAHAAVLLRRLGRQRVFDSVEAVEAALGREAPRPAGAAHSGIGERAGS